MNNAALISPFLISIGLALGPLAPGSFCYFDKSYLACDQAISFLSRMFYRFSGWAACDEPTLILFLFWLEEPPLLTAAQHELTRVRLVLDWKDCYQRQSKRLNHG